MNVEPTRFPKGLDGVSNIVSIGFGVDSEIFGLSNWKDGIPINHDRFEPRKPTAKTKANLCC